MLQNEGHDNNLQIGEKQSQKQIQIYVRKDNHMPVLKPTQKQGSLPPALTLESIKTNPLHHINSKTTRETLFKIAIILEQQNLELINKFEASKKYLIDEQNIDEKYQLMAEKTNVNRKIDVRYLKEHNKKQVAQKQILQLYQAQYQELAKILKEKSQIYDGLCTKKRTKQAQHTTKMHKIQQLSQLLLRLKQEKARLTDQVNRKKNNERNHQSNELIQKLLCQYYETIKRVMANDDSYSIDRITGNMRNAISHANFKHDFHPGNNQASSHSNSRVDGKSHDEKRDGNQLMQFQKLMHKMSSQNQSSIDF